MTKAELAETRSHFENIIRTRRIGGPDGAPGEAEAYIRFLHEEAKFVLAGDAMRLERSCGPWCEGCFECEQNLNRESDI